MLWQDCTISHPVEYASMFASGPELYSAASTAKACTAELTQVAHVCQQLLLHTFEKLATGDKGQVSEPAFQAIKDVCGIDNGSSSHFTLLPAQKTAVWQTIPWMRHAGQYC